jgi:predicted RNA-binding Zn-ribbon protein involved in translation (DUF1610 family)
MIGSGSVITRDVPAYGLVMGNPARLKGFVCPCGEKLIKKEMLNSSVSLQCPKCGFTTTIAQEDYADFLIKELMR